MIPPRHIVAASALVQNAAGDLLLVRTYKRGWEVPGGQVEIGESLIEAAVRETQEEAGVTIRISGLGTVQSNLSRGLVIFGFFGEYLGGELSPSDETPEVAWVPREQMLARITHPAIYDRVRFLLAFDGQVMYHTYYLDPYTVVSEIRL